MSSYLKNISIEHYGSLKDRVVGPFGPGLNVVFGPNEAGKTSVASFVGGVLFGWEEARGIRNTYRPAEGERAGSLEFAPRASDSDGVDDVSGRGATLRRERNEDGLAGDAGIVADIDNATYRTMFWLTSDELRSLRNTSDVTARLLAAGSATGSSPAEAYVAVEQRIAALTAPGQQGSIQSLEATLDEQRAFVDARAEAMALLKQEDQERRSLVESRAATAARIDELEARVAQLRETRVQLESIDAQAGSRERQLAELQDEIDAAAMTASSDETFDERLLSLDPAAERALRGELDDLHEEQVRATRALELARENSEASQAAYDALLEIDEDEAVASRALSNRRAQAVISVLLPIAFVAAGVLVFAWGRQTRSLSFTVFGVALVALACVLGAAAIFVFSRPNKGAEALAGRRRDAQWVMVQDQKKLEASLRAKEQVDNRIRAFLDEEGLAGAAASIRHARSLLDDAREVRAERALASQRLDALALRRSAAAAELERLRGERAHAAGALGLDAAVGIAVIDDLVVEASAERDALSMAYDDMNQRFGELEQRLSQALEDRSLDVAKLEYHQTRCRLHEAKHELVELLLAKRMLDRSIAAWESLSQPEVYAEASRLFSFMTDGAWARMGMMADGRMVAVSAEGEVRDVRHLSLGTCQQLYLALRVALLESARSVGRNVPVIADDVLVHFDSQRRANAASVLARLARARQVIVFTGHRETVEALRAADSELELLEL